WNGFIRSHANVDLILCGHAGRAFRTVTGDAGNTVHEMLYNTQDLPNGGDGWLRLLHFYPDGRTVRALTYSAYLDEWDRSGSDEFTFHLDSVSTSDTDQDGLPDWYEGQHQLDPNVADAHLDADGDGKSNCEEFLAATHPRDPKSLFRATAFELRDGHVEVCWESVPGLTYGVESNGSLGATGWTYEQTVQAENVLTRATVPVSGPRRFFRVVAE
ncbi:MAG TPA: hypothetical protein VIY86_06085, partial [Pirellulaceae bacterium]